MADYGSSDSGASLGDILGAALKAKAEDTDRHLMTRLRLRTKHRPTTHRPGTMVIPGEDGDSE